MSGYVKLEEMLRGMYPESMAEKVDPHDFRRWAESHYGPIFKDRSHIRRDFAQELLAQVKERNQ